MTVGPCSRRTVQNALWGAHAAAAAARCAVLACNSKECALRATFADALYIKGVLRYCNRVRLWLEVSLASWLPQQRTRQISRAWRCNAVESRVVSTVFRTLFRQLVSLMKRLEALAAPHAHGVLPPQHVDSRRAVCLTASETEHRPAQFATKILKPMPSKVLDKGTAKVCHRVGAYCSWCDSAAGTTGATTGCCGGVSRGVPAGRLRPPRRPRVCAGMAPCFVRSTLRQPFRQRRWRQDSRVLSGRRWHDSRRRQRRQRGRSCDSSCRSGGNERLGHFQQSSAGGWWHRCWGGWRSRCSGSACASAGAVCVRERAAQLARGPQVLRLWEIREVWRGRTKAPSIATSPYSIEALRVH